MATAPGSARAARRCRGPRRPRHHPRQHRRGHPFPVDRPAGERRLEAGRGEPLGPRRQGRDAARRLAVADDLRRRRLGGAVPGGVEAACESYGLPLIGGDTIALPPGAPRVLGMTAIGRAGPRTPDRAGGLPGDALWVIGTLGDSAAGLAQLRRDPRTASPLVDIYRRPIPQLGAGQLLAPHAHAMMDVSDGLLLDARRIAEASRCTARIELDALPLSDGFIDFRGSGRAARLFAATAGRRLCLARRAASRDRPVNAFFTRRDDDGPRGGARRRRSVHLGRQRRAANRAAGDIGF